MKPKQNKREYRPQLARRHYIGDDQTSCCDYYQNKPKTKNPSREKIKNKKQDKIKEKGKERDGGRGEKWKLFNLN